MTVSRLSLHSLKQNTRTHIHTHIHRRRFDLWLCHYQVTEWMTKVFTVALEYVPSLLDLINSTITKAIQSFSFGKWEKNKKDSNIVQETLPSKDQTSANAVKGKWVTSVTRLVLHYNLYLSAENWNKTSSQRNQASNCKSPMHCLLFYMWSVWFRLCWLYNQCWT